MPANRLIEFLDSRKVKYVSISHSPAYTAQEIAAAAHVRGKELAKTVILKIDGAIAMAVLPASYHIDLKQLKAAIGVKKVELASEDDFADIFTDCELGAMPPFGNLYDVDVYAAESLAEDSEIVFNACSHTQLVRMAWKDFQELVEPKIMKFSRQV